MVIETFPVGPLACNCTLVFDETTREAIVIDGGDGVDEVTRRVRERDLVVRALLHTHAHIDHIGDVGRLRKETQARAFLHPDDLPLYRALEWQVHLIGLSYTPAIVDIDEALHDGQTIDARGIRMEVLHTPGHTPGSVCFYVGDGHDALVFTGDTLFAGSIGRWDLGGTSMEDIVASIHGKLMTLPDTCAVIPGHGPATTIGRERNENPFLQ